MSNLGTETNNGCAHQEQPEDEFPERPGQPECTYYMQTGDCIFKPDCKYHHPKNHIPKFPSCALSDKGLPLRPGEQICIHYSRYGICKFGPACLYDHPIEPAASMARSPEDQAGMSETGSESDASI